MTTTTPVRPTIAARPTIPSERYADRLRRFAELVAERSMAAALIGVGPDLEYLTGYRAMPMERLTLLAVVSGRSPTLVVPRLEEPAARAGLRTDVDISTWIETDDPHGLVAGLVREFTNVFRGGGIGGRVDAGHVRRHRPGAQRAYA